MDTRSVFAGDGHHGPERTLTGSSRKPGRRESDRTEQRPSILPGTVQPFAGIEMRKFVEPRIMSQNKYTMKDKQSRFVFSILRSFLAHIRLANLRGSETQNDHPHRLARSVVRNGVVLSNVRVVGNSEVILPSFATRNIWVIGSSLPDGRNQRLKRRKGRSRRRRSDKRCVAALLTPIQQEAHRRSLPSRQR